MIRNVKLMKFRRKFRRTYKKEKKGPSKKSYGVGEKAASVTAQFGVGASTSCGSSKRGESGTCDRRWPKDHGSGGIKDRKVVEKKLETSGGEDPKGGLASADHKANLSGLVLG